MLIKYIGCICYASRVRPYILSMKTNFEKYAVIAAFLAVYLIWGSTYLGIRIAVETMPPFTLGALRFLSAGALLYAIARFRGAPAPELRHWGTAAVIGFCLSTLGNGLVIFAEKRAPSSFAALLVPTVSMWLVVLNWRFGDRRRPHALSLAGIALALAGTIILSSGGIASAQLDLHAIDVIALLAAPMAWAIGSLYARNAAKTSSIFLDTGMQMFAGGVFLVLFAFAAGEPGIASWSDWSYRSLAAAAYLTVLGSIVAFTAYSYLIRRVSPAMLGTYSFVNPLIAMVLGAAIYGEPLASGSLPAAALILAGVGLILRANSAPKKSAVRKESPTPPLIAAAQQAYNTR